MFAKSLCACGLILLWIGAAHAQGMEIKHRFCMGQESTSCPEQPHFGCPQDTGVGAEEIAKSMCTINTAEGKKVLDFQVVPKSSKGGNRCGYTVYEVTCFRSNN